MPLKEGSPEQGVCRTMLGGVGKCARLGQEAGSSKGKARPLP